MANPNFITDEDLWRRMGGRDKLTQLLDPERTGTWDADTAATARQDACNLILSSAGIHAEHVVDVTEFRDKFPHLVTIAAQQAIVLLWQYGSSGQAMPEGVAALAVNVEAQRQELVNKRLKQGTPEYNPQSPQKIVGAVDLDPGNSRMTLSSWKAGGFC